MSTTETPSHYNHLEQMSVLELLTNINKEDKTVPLAAEKAIPQLEKLVEAAVAKMKEGGRLFYIGAGTSGRLGVVDASECPPTFGVPFDMVIGIMAGGDTAIRKAVEFAEDDFEQAIKDLDAYGVNEKDVVVGIAASGRTPYVIGGLQACNERGITTGCVVCNADSKVAAVAQFPVEVVTGPEFLTGSTRMKAGTGQKLALNMLTTSIMIRLGKVKGNKMVDMQLTNHKLVDRGTRMIMEELNISEEKARELLDLHGSVRAAITSYASH
ncbi:N-acetylmuramic acid 6-phosphate etherase [Rufibacter glacialis]|uniref:N-acetylmuramic acid 6-phosphate etherase n=1 Tax=Rufibacter glacialis TaxID=1259555 RepID=A0A5M8Q7M7_9BACT|nr:N-acetylmuramic acid 6-phosphate etherase [Rufibacter glacialis]KAA6431128.1 N-acetylmuramic acid 6-phosphate etherase [Rufibacter glacialis]GGK84250.1 N-acetylmuramic acid 6-phosphate etherase [Rufibacter glacialis]